VGLVVQNCRDGFTSFPPSRWRAWATGLSTSRAKGSSPMSCPFGNLKNGYTPLIISNIALHCSVSSGVCVHFPAAIFGLCWQQQGNYQRHLGSYIH